MGLDRIERESAWIAELVFACDDRRGFWEQLLDRLDHTIGFDKASMHGMCPGVINDSLARGYDVPARFDELPRFMAELEPHELADASRGRPIVDVDALSSRRREQLSLYRCLLRPERITVFTTTMWRVGAAVAGLNLARTGRGARFLARELRFVEALLPTIRLADAYAKALQPPRGGDPFEAWADHAGLSVKQRAVAALVVRGLRNPEIAAVLAISPHTVRNQLAAVFRKADVSTRAELVYIVSTFMLDRPAEEPRWLRSIG
jgi:DNA-binding CsgD family transcriptional regulator